MTKQEKRELHKALHSIKGNVSALAEYLERPYVSLDILADGLQWADDCYDGLVQGVDGARDDDSIDWTVFASLVWTRNEVGCLREALRYCVEEQPRTD